MDLKTILGEELFNQVNEKLNGKRIMIDDDNFIPKSRFNEVNAKKKELEKQLEELTETKLKFDELLSQKKELENKISTMEFDFVLEDNLKSSKCKNNKVLKSLLDLTSMVVKDGKIEGLDEQIKKLQETDSYLFDLEENSLNTGKMPKGNRIEGGIKESNAERIYNSTEKTKVDSNFYFK